MNKLQIRYSNRYKTSRKNLSEKDKILELFLADVGSHSDIFG